MDVSMLREDYEKFLEVFINGIPDHDDLYLEMCNDGRNKCFLKLKHKDFVNIGIDIFPYDYYYKPTNDAEKEELAQDIRKFFKQNSLKFRLLQPIYIHSSKLMRKRFEKITKTYILKNNEIDLNNKPTLMYGLDYPMLERMKIPFYDYDTVLPLKTVEFEGTEFYCPNDTDKFLRHNYGDYMTLPKDCYARHCNPQYVTKMSGFDDFITAK